MSRLAPFLGQLDGAIEKIGVANTAVAALGLAMTGTGQALDGASAIVDGLQVGVSSVQDTLTVAVANAANMDGLIQGINAGLFRADAQGVELVGNMRVVVGLLAHANKEILKLDPRGIEQSLQELIADIQTGKASAEEFVSMLEEKAPAIGELVAALLEQFKNGELRADQLQDRLNDLITKFDTAFKAGGAASSALGAALQQLGQLAQSGDLLRDLRRAGKI